MQNNPSEKCATCGHRRAHHNQDERCYFIVSEGKHCTCKKFVPLGRM